MILSEQEPQLLDSLYKKEKPSLQEQELVTEVLADEFAKNYGPGHIPTERGVLIDNALGAFLVHWPQENLE